VQFAATEAARSEWFLQGTQQASFAMNSVATSAYSSRPGSQNTSESSGKNVAARITSPTTGTIIALDPDIPPNRQRVSFEAQGKSLQWLLDGKPLARGNATSWLPWPGRHTVQVTTPQGQVLDEIRIEVRGAGVRAGPDMSTARGDLRKNIR